MLIIVLEFPLTNYYCDMLNQSANLQNLGDAKMKMMTNRPNTILARWYSALVLHRLDASSDGKLKYCYGL